MEDTLYKIQQQFPNLQISQINVPEEHSLNDMLVNYGSNGIFKLLQAVKPVVSPTTDIIETNDEVSKFTVHNGQKFSFEGTEGTYYVLGQLPADLGTMKISLCFDNPTNKKVRAKLDLFEPNEVVNFSKQLKDVNITQLQIELFQLADHLEEYRNKQLEDTYSTPSKRTSSNLSPAGEREAIEFLKQKKLIGEIDKLIEASGVVGEVSNRKMLFIIASTYKMLNQLHALVQGTSGSGKSHLINSIAALIPPEDTINMTRITDKSLYSFIKDELVDKLILVQDMDGLDKEAMFAFREMQSSGILSSSTTIKDKHGNIQSVIRTANASFASLAVTTNAEIYFDNMSRSLVLGIDESLEQTQRIIREQNKRTAGLFERKKLKKLKNYYKTALEV